MIKKLILFLVIISVIGFGVYKLGKNYVSETVIHVDEYGDKGER